MSDSCRALHQRTLERWSWNRQAALDDLSTQTCGPAWPSSTQFPEGARGVEADLPVRCQALREAEPVRCQALREAGTDSGMVSRIGGASRAAPVRHPGIRPHPARGRPAGRAQMPVVGPPLAAPRAAGEITVETASSTTTPGPVGRPCPGLGSRPRPGGNPSSDYGSSVQGMFQHSGGGGAQ